MAGLTSVVPFSSTTKSCLGLRHGTCDPSGRTVAAPPSHCRAGGHVPKPSIFLMRRRAFGYRQSKAIKLGPGFMQVRSDLKVMISGAPASGKGTQCELIVEKFGVNHISTGELLRAEVASGSDIGKVARQYMDAGKLVPNEIVIGMVEKALDGSMRGWLLDGFPRTLEQAEALEAIKVRPQMFIILDVPDEVLIERVVGRRMDPVTGKVYHIKHFPPETTEIANRVTQRSDDTEEKAKLRLATYCANVEAVVGIYKDVIKHVDGNRPKKEVFEDIARLLSDLQEEGKVDVTKVSSAEEGKVYVSDGLPPGEGKVESSLDEGEVDVSNGSRRAVKEGASLNASLGTGAIKSFRAKALKSGWNGVPTKLNTTPHSREIREYFYSDVCSATKSAVEDGIHKLRVQITIPELNPAIDVYRIGTLLEITREIAFAFANDGKRVRVCVQGPMGEGIFSGMPLQLSGTRRLLEAMDWADSGTFVTFGAVGAKEVKPEDDMFIILAPQNAVANCIIDDLQAMVTAAGDRPVIILNPRLKDVPGAAGVMQVQGRDKRIDFVESFFTCYNFRLLYQAGTFYPIVGALRMAYPSPYEIYKRIDTEGKSKEEYLLLSDTFEKEPTGSQISDIFEGRPRKQDNNPRGIWALFDKILG